MAAPASSLPPNSMYLSTDTPISTAAQVNVTHDTSMTPRRPILVLRAPAMRANTAAAARVADTISSCQTDVSPNSFLSNIIAPDITLVSYPNMNPPSDEKNVNTYTKHGVVTFSLMLSIFKSNRSSSRFSYNFFGLLLPFVPLNWFVLSMPVCLIVHGNVEKQSHMLHDYPPNVNWQHFIDFPWEVPLQGQSLYRILRNSLFTCFSWCPLS